MIAVTPNYNLLTAKQKKVYVAIEGFIKTRGIPPTVREIGEIIGEKTPGAVQGILNRLEQKGVIKRTLGMARSIQLVSENSQYVNPVYIPHLRKINNRNVLDIFNLYNIMNYLPMPPELVKNPQNAFMINCPDNSLAPSGVTYEDILLIDTACEYKDGDILMVLYNNLLLLRKYYRSAEEDKLILKADSDIIGTDIFPVSEISIVGKLIGKYTHY